MAICPQQQQIDEPEVENPSGGKPLRE